MMNEELKTILTKFAESGWDIIDAPAKDYLSGNNPVYKHHSDYNRNGASPLYL